MTYLLRMSFFLCTFAVQKESFAVSNHLSVVETFISAHVRDMSINAGVGIRTY